MCLPCNYHGRWREAGSGTSIINYKDEPVQPRYKNRLWNRHKEIWGDLHGCAYNFLEWRLNSCCQLLVIKHSAKGSIVQKGYFTKIVDKASPVTRDSSVVARTLSRRCYPRTGLKWWLSSSPSLSVGLLGDKHVLTTEWALTEPVFFTYQTDAV